MTLLQSPSPQQEAALREQAKLLQAAYARFPVAAPEPYQSSMWLVMKGYVELALQQPPNAFDWRDHIAIPPAKYQGGCNSCTSFAAAATIEIATIIANGGEAPDVAAQHMHTCIVHGGQSDVDAVCRGGIEPRRLLKLLKETGYAVSLSDDMPFPPASCPAAGIYSVLVDFEPIAVSAARSRLTNGPIFTDMYIWGDFFDYTTNRTPTYSPNMSLGQPVLHSVCVVGYTPDGWIIKNSFGSDWGDGTGFGMIKMGTCGLLTESPPPGWAPRPAFVVQV